MRCVGVKMAFFMHRLIVFGDRQTAFLGSYKRNEIVFLSPSGTKNLHRLTEFETDKHFLLDVLKHRYAWAWAKNQHRLMVFAPTCSILIEIRRPRKWKILHRLMVFTFSISTLYDDDLVCKRQKPAQAHGFCILWLSTIGLQSCLGGAETCTGTWLLYPVVQRYRTMIELGSDKSCTGTWFLRS